MGRPYHFNSVHFDLEDVLLKTLATDSLTLAMCVSLYVSLDHLQCLLDFLFVFASISVSDCVSQHCLQFFPDRIDFSHS